MGQNTGNNIAEDEALVLFDEAMRDGQNESISSMPLDGIHRFEIPVMHSDSARGQALKKLFVLLNSDDE